MSKVEVMTLDPDLTMPSTHAHNHAIWRSFVNLSFDVSGSAAEAQACRHALTATLSVFLFMATVKEPIAQDFCLQVDTCAKRSCILLKFARPCNLMITRWRNRAYGPQEVTYPSPGRG